MAKSRKPRRTGELLLPAILAKAPAYAREAYEAAKAAGTIAPSRSTTRFARPTPGPNYADLPTYHMNFLGRLLKAEAEGVEFQESDHLMAVRGDWGIAAPWEVKSTDTGPCKPMRLGILCGPAGCGKTTALVWCGQLAARASRTVRYLKAGNIADFCRDKKLRPYYRPDVLLLDDLHLAPPGGWLEELQLLVDHFYSLAGRVLLCGAQGKAAEIKARVGPEVYGRLTDRWAAGALIESTNTDFRGDLR
jgi:hypothetical protein